MSASQTEDSNATPEAPAVHFVVLVIGARIARIGAARGFQ